MSLDDIKNLIFVRVCVEGLGGMCFCSDDSHDGMFLLVTSGQKMYIYIPIYKYLHMHITYDV